MTDTLLHGANSNNNISNNNNNSSNGEQMDTSKTASPVTTNMMTESPQPAQLHQVAPKKGKRRAHSKTARACNHCHKLHMTCDESRPCKRCVQRGLGETCVDAPRKKKKYMIDLPENLTPTWSPSSPGGVFVGSNDSSVAPYNDENNKMAQYASLLTQFQYRPKTEPAPVPTPPDLISQQSPNPTQVPFSLPSIDKLRKTPFLSDAADLEYSVLGNIVNDPNSPSMSPGAYHSSPMEDSRSSYPQPFNGLAHHNNSSGQHQRLSLQGRSLTNSHLQNNDVSTLSSNKAYANDSAGYLPYRLPSLPPQPKPRYEKRLSSAQSSARSNSEVHATSLYSDRARYDVLVNQYYIGPVHGVNEETSNSVSFPEIIDFIKENEQNNPKSFFNNQTSSISFSIGLTSEDEYNRKVVDHENISYKHGGLKYKEPSEIYSKTIKPFSYYPGYHQLLNYLTSRFNKKQLVMILKKMAEYRPSFIAATCNLKEDDLIFMEQCFQRTLLEYDNYISISGTPTIVWRRTGQIAYVGNEFSILTGYSKERLLDRITLIVELLDDESVVNYFKLFNKIAFADFTGASMSECTLLSSTGHKIKCRCLITLKRDVFGIPMMIIGNFLPILSEYGHVEE